MNKFRLLFAEDNEQEIKTYSETIIRIKKEKDLDLSCEFAGTLEEASEKINNSYDGVIVDIKLGQNAEAGVELANTIIKEYRIPVAVYTATPGKMENIEHSIFFTVYKKGETGLETIIMELLKIYNTGITQILGKNGQIDSALNKIFWKQLIGDFNKFISASEKNKEQKILFRYILSLLNESLHSEYDEEYIPEETYIIPPINEAIKTGNIVKNNQTNNLYIILSPACDLTVHNGQIKTERILVCQIEKNDTIKDKKPDIKKIISNNYSFYYHFLPKTGKFDGGFINFRKIETYEPDNFNSNFKIVARVTAPFIKDIVARFSVYYSRQGQPDFNVEELVKDFE